MSETKINYAPETCQFCDGEGADFNRQEEYYRRCPVCRGAGSLLVAQPARKCAFCKGKAEDFWREDYHYDRCPTCKGAGWAHALPPK
jgi:DnaJ-class molecular chaperone